MILNKVSQEYHCKPPIPGAVGDAGLLVVREVVPLWAGAGAVRAAGLDEAQRAVPAAAVLAARVLLVLLQLGHLPQGVEHLK